MSSALQSTTRRRSPSRSASIWRRRARSPAAVGGLAQRVRRRRRHTMSCDAMATLPFERSDHRLGIASSALRGTSRPSTIPWIRSFSV